MRNPYAVLELQPGASRSEIKRAYRRLVKKLHPDLNPESAGTTARLQEIQQAYRQLSHVPDVRATSAGTPRTARRYEPSTRTSASASHKTKVSKQTWVAIRRTEAGIRIGITPPGAACVRPRVLRAFLLQVLGSLTCGLLTRLTWASYDHLDRPLIAAAILLGLLALYTSSKWLTDPDCIYVDNDAIYVVRGKRVEGIPYLLIRDWEFGYDPLRTFGFRPFYLHINLAGDRPPVRLSARYSERELRQVLDRALEFHVDWIES